MIAVHIRKNSPKKPQSKFSVYLNPSKFGISWKLFGMTGMWIRFKYGGFPGPQTVRVIRANSRTPPRATN